MAVPTTPIARARGYAPLYERKAFTRVSTFSRGQTATASTTISRLSDARGATTGVANGYDFAPTGGLRSENT